MGKKISFQFLALVYQKDLAILQFSSKFQQVNTITNKEPQISLLQQELSYL